MPRWNRREKPDYRNLRDVTDEAALLNARAVHVEAIVEDGIILLVCQGMRHEIDLDEAEMVAESLVRQLAEGGCEVVLCTEPTEGKGCYDYSLTRQEAHVAALSICAAAAALMERPVKLPAI